MDNQVEYPRRKLRRIKLSGTESIQNEKYKSKTLQFYRNLIQPCILKLKTEQDKLVCSAWLNQLDNDNSLLKNLFMKLLLVSIHSSCSLYIFSQFPPKDLSELNIKPEEINNTMKILKEQQAETIKLDSRKYGLNKNDSEWKAAVSTDLCSYVTFKISKHLAQSFYVRSDSMIHTWYNPTGIILPHVLNASKWEIYLNSLKFACKENRCNEAILNENCESIMNLEQVSNEIISFKWNVNSILTYNRPKLVTKFIDIDQDIGNQPSTQRQIDETAFSIVENKIFPGYKILNPKKYSTIIISDPTLVFNTTGVSLSYKKINQTQVNSCNTIEKFDQKQILINNKRLNKTMNSIDQEKIDNTESNCKMQYKTIHDYSSVCCCKSRNKSLVNNFPLENSLVCNKQNFHGHNSTVRNISNQSNKTLQSSLKYLRCYRTLSSDDVTFNSNNYYPNYNSTIETPLKQNKSYRSLKNCKSINSLFINVGSSYDETCGNFDIPNELSYIDLRDDNCNVDNIRNTCNSSIRSKINNNNNYNWPMSSGEVPCRINICPSTSNRYPTASERIIINQDTKLDKKNSIQKKLHYNNPIKAYGEEQHLNFIESETCGYVTDNQYYPSLVHKISNEPYHNFNNTNCSSNYDWTMLKDEELPVNDNVSSDYNSRLKSSKDYADKSLMFMSRVKCRSQSVPDKSRGKDNPLSINMCGVTHKQNDENIYLNRGNNISQLIYNENKNISINENSMNNSRQTQQWVENSGGYLPGANYNSMNHQRSCNNLQPNCVDRDLLNLQNSNNKSDDHSQLTKIVPKKCVATKYSFIKTLPQIRNPTCRKQTTTILNNLVKRETLNPNHENISCPAHLDIRQDTSLDILDHVFKQSSAISKINYCMGRDETISRPNYNKNFDYYEWDPDVSSYSTFKKRNRRWFNDSGYLPDEQHDYTLDRKVSLFDSRYGYNDDIAATNNIKRSKFRNESLNSRPLIRNNDQINTNRIENECDQCINNSKPWSARKDQFDNSSMNVSFNADTRGNQSQRSDIRNISTPNLSLQSIDPANESLNNSNTSSFSKICANLRKKKHS